MIEYGEECYSEIVVLKIYDIYALWIKLIFALLLRLLIKLDYYLSTCVKLKYKIVQKKEERF